MLLWSMFAETPQRLSHSSSDHHFYVFSRAASKAYPSLSDVSAICVTHVSVAGCTLRAQAETCRGSEFRAPLYCDAQVCGMGKTGFADEPARTHNFCLERGAACIECCALLSAGRSARGRLPLSTGAADVFWRICSCCWSPPPDSPQKAVSLAGR